MTGAPPIEDERLAAAVALLRDGRTGQAVAALRTLVADGPPSARVYEQLALALETAGDRAGAEDSLREALRIDPASAAAAIRLAMMLVNRRAAAEAIEILAPLAGSDAADIHLHTAHGMALKALGRLGEAAAAYARAAAAAPTSGVAEHNLAGVLGDAHRFAESKDATRRAFAKGLDAPETWLVQGRALQGLGDFEAADAAFREAIRRRANYADAHGDLAQLVWMRTEDVSQAREALDIALKTFPADRALSVVKARLLEYADDLEGGYAVIADAIVRQASDPELHVTAAWLIAAKDPALALAHAERAYGMAPNMALTATALCQANLGVGRADAAAALAEALCADWPLDQYPVALASTAWRMMGDDRYRELYDYDDLVRARTIETPDGWTHLEAFLSDLAAELRRLQQLRAHPIGQSLRHGSQTGQSLALSAEPVIQAFFAAIDPAIRQYIDGLRRRDDRHGRRATEAYRFAGAWSALLRPNGYHANHLHPLGWISSACHIELPGSVEDGHEGWLQFGEPGLATAPAMPAEHFVKPKAGDLVLFPSYMWHGTIPFSGPQSRLAAAFDVLPA